MRGGEIEKIGADVRYLVCRDVCIPGHKRLEMTLPVKNRAAAGPESQLFEAARRRLPRPAPGSWRISATSVGDEFLLRLRVGKPAVDSQFFPSEPEQIENAAPQKAIAAAGGMQLHLKKSKHLLKPIWRIKGVMLVSGAAYLVDVPVSQSPDGAHLRSIKN